jgi:hypothetical protein
MEFSPAETHQKQPLNLFRTWLWGVFVSHVGRSKIGKGFWHSATELVLSWLAECLLLSKAVRGGMSCRQVRISQCRAIFGL